MLSPRLASRYAKSLMLIAVEQNQTDAVVKDMHLLQETLQSSAELRIMFTSPIVPYDKKLRVVGAI
jgi:F-type H+-transporting ATPase subunit delta